MNKPTGVYVAWLGALVIFAVCAVCYAVLGLLADG